MAIRMENPFQLCTFSHLSGFGTNYNELEPEAIKRMTKELEAHIKVAAIGGRKVLTAVTAQYQTAGAKALEATGFKTLGPVVGTEKSIHMGQTVTLWQRNLTDEDLKEKVKGVKKATPKTIGGGVRRGPDGRFLPKEKRINYPWPKGL